MSTKYQLVDKKLLEVQMDSNYHIFKKPVKSKNKTIHRWYYYFIDPVTGKKVQKVCRGCKTQAEAYAFVSSLPPVFVEEKTTIAKIAEWMYIPGSPHLERQKKLGKVFTPETLKIKRFALNIIVEEFGHLELQELTIPMVIDFLMNDKKHSGSWKNGFLTVVGELYAEAPFHNLPYIPVPQFPKFRRNSKKKDIFTVDELNTLFDEKVFVVDGFWRSNQLVRTTFNKCGSDDDKKIRVAPLPDDFAQMMEKYIQDNNLGPDDYVFQRYGKPIRKWIAEEWFRNILLSGEVVSYKNVIYNRTNDSDVKVTSTTDIAQMYIRKQEIFTERKVFPYVKLEDIRIDLLPLVRTMAKNNSAGSHPWEKLSDEELLKSAGLYTVDRLTGEKGFNLAAVMLLGKDEVIHDVVPTYSTDALLRKVNVDRYDDRLIVETNLIESYDRLFEFATKHLLDKFYLEDGKVRISLRNILAREMIVNTLMHREFSSGYQAKFIIERDKMYVENANRARKDGLITPENLEPYAKNPLIASFFRNIGYSDKLGSGVRKLFNYSHKYSGGNPEFSEGDVFRITVPLNDDFSWDAGNIPNAKEISPANIPSSNEISPALRNKIAALGKRQNKEIVKSLIIELCKESPKTKKQLAEIFQRDEEYMKKFYLSKMVGEELELTIPNNPTDPNQAYKAR